MVVVIKKSSPQSDAFFDRSVVREGDDNFYEGLNDFNPQHTHFSHVSFAPFIARNQHALHLLKYLKCFCSRQNTHNFQYDNFFFNRI